MLTSAFSSKVCIVFLHRFVLFSSCYTHTAQSVFYWVSLDHFTGATCLKEWEKQILQRCSYFLSQFRNCALFKWSPPHTQYIRLRRDLISVTVSRRCCGGSEQCTLSTWLCQSECFSLCTSFGLNNIFLKHTCAHQHWAMTPPSFTAISYYILWLRLGHTHKHTAH